MNTEINEVENQPSNPILDIVASIQSKLNEVNTVEPTTPKQTSNTDFSGLDISKIVSMLNTSNSKNIGIHLIGFCADNFDLCFVIGNTNFRRQAPLETG